MNYNFIAPYYHSLSKLIFFNQQHKAHYPILEFLKKSDKILWVGGGAGKFIREIDDLRIEIEIDYVDFSSKMIELAQKVKTNHLKLNFITTDIFDFESTKEYDVIITTFLFDHFSQSKAEELFTQLNKYLKLNGIWFYVDFAQNQKGWQKGITKLMLGFFTVVIGLSNAELPRMNNVFNAKFDKIKYKSFFSNYIESIIYKKK